MKLRALRPWLCLLAMAATSAADLSVIRLENRNVVVEIVPRFGGRIATLRRPTGENVFSYIAPPNGALPTAEPGGGFMPGNGHVVWVGPQNDWWAQQAINPARKAERATWPPDPFLEYGELAITAQTPEQLSLRGPLSPVSGIRLQTTIRLMPDGAVVQEIAATNVSERTVAWDLWPNTRVRADAQVYAPYAAGSRLKVVYNTCDPQAEIPLLPIVADGFLSFDTRLAAGTEHQLHSVKAFLTATDSRLFAVAPHDLLIAVAQTPAKGDIHREHSPIEVFQCIGGEPIRDVLELEFHSAYRTLPPGAVLRFALAWQLVPYAGASTPEAHRQAIRAHDATVAKLHELLLTVGQ